MADYEHHWMVIPLAAIDGKPNPSAQPSEAVKLLREWRGSFQYKNLNSKIAVAMEHYPTGRVMALMANGQVVNFPGHTPVPEFGVDFVA